MKRPKLDHRRGKLTREQVLAIRGSRLNDAVLGKRYGISASAVYGIRTCATYRNIV